MLTFENESMTTVIAAFASSIHFNIDHNIKECKNKNADTRVKLL